MKDQRHHQSHPPSSVSPNLAVNKKPSVAPPEKSAVTNPNPSLGPVGVDAVNSRVPTAAKVLTRENDDLNCDIDIDEDCVLEIS